jgi:two-component system, NtrC family, response regulator AtoC
MKRILVVENEGKGRSSTAQGLTNAGFLVDVASTAAHGLELLKADAHHDLVLVDDQLSDAAPLEVVTQIKLASPRTITIVMAAFSNIRVGVEALQCGAADYMTKPINVDALAQIIRHALTAGMPTTDRPTSHPKDGDSLVGRSEPMARVRALMERVAASPVSTVLLTGESGTGKDLIAKEIHNQSPRADRPFVNITCSALPEALLESELFGYEAGAFTSAARQKKGLFELADEGTVFLDEIGEMALSLQAKLLRFTEARAFRRVGGTRDVLVDVRVVAATNRDLADEVAKGRFREDLYYRLRVLPIHLPPLRERKDDIIGLAHHFIIEFSRAFNKRVVGIDPSAVERLTAHPWPGNVRELRHTIERAVLLAEGDYLSATDCGLGDPTPSEHAFQLPTGGLVLSDVERSLVHQALQATGWNLVRAGRLLGLNRDQIRYRIEKFALVPDTGDHCAA